MGKIRKVTYGETEFEYNEDTPCLVCGEPVIGASMGGTAICGACDCGKCRYCGMTIFVMNPEIDGGKSKESTLKHMEWHKRNNPELVERINNGTRKMLDKFEDEDRKRKTAGQITPPLAGANALP